MIKKIFILLSLFFLNHLLNSTPLNLEYEEKFYIPEGDEWWMSYYKCDCLFNYIITSLVYTPSGDRLVVGTNSGDLF